MSYRWEHPDPELDLLCRDLQTLVKRAESRQASRAEIFAAIWARACGEGPRDVPDRAAIPYLNEPWYC